MVTRAPIGILGNAILKRAAEMHKLPVAELIGPCRSRYYVEARFAAMAALRNRGMSTTRIGRLLGNRDHSSVIHGCKRAAQMAAAEPGYADIIAELEAV